VDDAPESTIGPSNLRHHPSREDLAAHAR
jgi:hypothetical protein